VCAASMQSLKRKVASLLDDLETALSGPASSAPADDGSAAAALNAALAEDEESMPPPTGSSASPFSLGSGSPFALGSGSLSPPAPLTATFNAVAAGLPASGRRASSSFAPRKVETMAELDALVGAAGAASKPPLCRPHSRDDFYARVRTFRSARGWFDKPAVASPLQCARFGWCLDASTPDVLVCSVCAVCIKCPALLHEQETVDALAAELRTGHRPLCAWLGNASPESFASLLLPAQPGSGALPSLVQGAPQALEALRQREAALLRMRYLPALAPSLAERLDECARAAGIADGDALLRALAARTKASGAAAAAAGGWSGGAEVPAVEALRRSTALCLALLGWRPAALVTPLGGAEPEPTIECVEDGRTLGLWHYQRLEPRAGAPPTSSAPSPATLDAAAARSSPAGGWKRSRVSPAAGDAPAGAASALGPLDPVAEHRPWSPWLAVAPGDTVAAWMRCAALLLPRDSSAGGGEASSRAVAAALALL